MRIALTNKGMQTSTSTLYALGLSCKEIDELKAGNVVETEPKELKTLTDNDIAVEETAHKKKKAEVDNGVGDIESEG